MWMGTGCGLSTCPRALSEESAGHGLHRLIDTSMWHLVDKSLKHLGTDGRVAPGDVQQEGADGGGDQPEEREASEQEDPEQDDEAVLIEEEDDVLTVGRQEDRQEPGPVQRG